MAPRVNEIESPANPQFKLWHQLLEGRGLRRHGRYLLAGRKTVPEALARSPGEFEAVLCADLRQLDALPLPDRMARHRLARPLFDALDVAGTGLPLLVGIVPEMPPIDLAAPPQGLELVCALGDPSNLGALLRSAAAFGASRVILLDEAAHPFHPRCLRAAANAQLALELRRGPGWPGLAAAAGPLLALDAGGRSMTDYPWPADLRLVLGEEGQGIPDGLPAERLAIPTTGAVESLNATVAATLALHAWFVARGPQSAR
ncbi:TrmH family RNA methyltransferase [Arenibaculum pallidiluteum]|uniref:TrmH family RNA methyltransferase n=1 Tax=Arenibaculum pallidiluteum TaxID=2812559 RepID=UPI001A957473|nr:RNA methyltransferase [Arenibaculum pallidiluteum]